MRRPNHFEAMVMGYVRGVLERTGGPEVATDESSPVAQYRHGVRQGSRDIAVAIRDLLVLHEISRDALGDSHYEHNQVELARVGRIEDGLR